MDFSLKTSSSCEYCSMNSWIAGRRRYEHHLVVVIPLPPIVVAVYSTITTTSYWPVLSLYLFLSVYLFPSWGTQLETFKSEDEQE